MRTNLIFVTVLTSLLVLVIVMNAHTRSTPVEQHLQELRGQVFEADWGSAKKVLSDLEEEWARRRVWLQLTKSTQTIVEIDRALSRLKAAIQVESRQNAADQVADLMVSWRDLKE